MDGAQSLGVYDINVDMINVDMVAFPGHKGLLGPQGTGGLYIREGLDIHGLVQGGTGSFSTSLDQPSIMPDKFEAGTPNGPGIIGLGEGVRFIQEIGIENIRRKEEDLTMYFIEEGKKIDGLDLYGTLERESHAPVVALNIRGKDSSEVSYILDEVYKIGVRPGLHCAPLAHETIGTLERGAIRFSFGYMNTFQEVEIGLEALRSIAKET